MYTRHFEVPVYYASDDTLEAAHFNRVQRALKRLGPSIRLSLPGLKSLALIVQADGWIVVDSAFNDLPVVAWTDFQRQEPNALHGPVRCRARLYHANARIIMRRVLAAMESLLDEQLREPEQGHRVLDFPGKASD